MHNKSNVSSIFVQFTTMVENQFSQKIKNFYSDNGGEFIKLRPILDAHGISHFTLHHILPSKMTLLNAVIDILSTLVWPSYIMLRRLPLIGPMP